MTLLSSALDAAEQSRSRLRADRIQTAVVQGPRPTSARPFLRRWLLGGAALVVVAGGLAFQGRPVAGDLPAIEVGPVPLAQVHLDRFVPARESVHSLLRSPDLAPAPQGTLDLARQLLDGPDSNAHFLALTVAVEGVRTRPYWDAAGLNVGMGYNVTRRLAEEGSTQVIRDLQHAGLDPTTIVTLTGKDRRAQARVQLTEPQAVALLREVAPEYRAKARAFIGEPTFDHLQPNQQDALSYLAYNAGKNLVQFIRLRQAVLAGKTDQALQHLMPSYRTAEGDLVVNTRAGAYLVAAFSSEHGLTQAVRQAEGFEAQVRAGRNAVIAADPLARPTLGQRLGIAAPAPRTGPSPTSPRLR